MANNLIPNVPDLSGKLAVVTGSNNAGVMTAFEFVTKAGSRREAPIGDSDVAGTESYERGRQKPNEHRSYA
jgi:hypothetical protein